MSLSAAVLDALVASGATQDMLVAAMKADIVVRATEEAGKLEAKRQSNRDRQNRKRERDRNAESRVTAVTTRDERDLGSNDRDILTSQKVIPPKPNGLVAPKPKSQKSILPNDWQPDSLAVGTMTAQIVERWEPGRLERELAKFRDHHTAAGSRFLCWQAAWRKWVGNSPDFERNRSNERSDRDPTTVAVERFLGNVGSHAGTG